ncbi:response regulator transcription factor [Achromobacter seleniivolatilans]|uniref:Response regulator transcription factor n=1 Tax=Achromobacter seleniivolatilans TaxID=3047478 RepID=A0ABY9LU34_9BURK|nr:response regulator transcription factor [Achromobacter sp. R39]WMD18294.1 response regulator transcription factor [Achromobacter sp. R39]
MNVAILEDSPAHVEWITKLLLSRGHQPFSRADGNSFIALLQQQKVDVVLLDWEVPGASGLAVLKWARSNLAPSLPILMVTQRDDEESIVLALNQGADDYLQKPVREGELLARVGAQLRKSQRGDASTQSFQVGRFLFNPEAQTLNVDGRAVSLSTREFNLAVLLFRNTGRIMTKDVLSQHIWGASDRKYDASLATYVSNLRSALGLRAHSGYVIATVYNYGYRLERLS